MTSRSGENAVFNLPSIVDCMDIRTSLHHIWPAHDPRKSVLFARPGRTCDAVAATKSANRPLYAAIQRLGRSSRKCQFLFRISEQPING
jgi:hypothetical protein